MLISISIKPGDSIYWFDKFGNKGDYRVDYIVIDEVEGELEIQYRDFFGETICTEKEISDNIEKDDMLYFYNEFIRDAYLKKIKEKK